MVAQMRFNVTVYVYFVPCKYPVCGVTEF